MKLCELTIERKISESLSECESNLRYSQYKNKYLQIFRNVQPYLPEHMVMQMYELDECSSLIIDICAGHAFRDGLSNNLFLGDNTNDSNII